MVEEEVPVKVEAESDEDGPRTKSAKRKSRTLSPSQQRRQEDQLVARERQRKFALEQDFNRNAAADDGCFWMEYDDFTHAFTRVDMCQTFLYGDWYHKQERARYPLHPTFSDP